MTGEWQLVDEEWPGLAGCGCVGERDEEEVAQVS